VDLTVTLEFLLKTFLRQYYNASTQGSGVQIMAQFSHILVH